MDIRETRKPPLLAIMKNRLSPEACARLRETFEQAYIGAQRNVLILEDNLKVYQLIDGKWRPLDLDSEAIEQALADELVIDRKAVREL